VTDRTRAVIRRLFAAADQVGIEALLEQQCGAELPLTDRWREPQFERLWLAVLKLSRGDITRLHETMRHAQRDWRDVLVWSGFGNSLEAHRRWADELTS
jgi:hypothetical protein